MYAGICRMPVGFLQSLEGLVACFHSLSLATDVPVMPTEIFCHSNTATGENIEGNVKNVAM